MCRGRRISCNPWKMHRPIWYKEELSERKLHHFQNFSLCSYSGTDTLRSSRNGGAHCWQWTRKPNVQRYASTNGVIWKRLFRCIVKNKLCSHKRTNNENYGQLLSAVLKKDPAWVRNVYQIGADNRRVFRPEKSFTKYSTCDVPGPIRICLFYYPEPLNCYNFRVRLSDESRMCLWLCLSYQQRGILGKYVARLPVSFQLL